MGCWRADYRLQCIGYFIPVERPGQVDARFKHTLSARGTGQDQGVYVEFGMSRTPYLRPIHLTGYSRVRTQLRCSRIFFVVFCLRALRMQAVISHSSPFCTVFDTGFVHPRKLNTKKWGVTEPTENQLMPCVRIDGNGWLCHGSSVSNSPASLGTGESYSPI